MTINGWIQIALYCAIIIAITKPLGGYMASVFNGEKTFLSPVLRPIERAFYAISGVDEKEDQNWVIYGVAMLAFSLAGFVSLYALMRLQNMSSLQPSEDAGCRRTSVVQHGDELRHQYQLAVLRS